MKTAARILLLLAIAGSLGCATVSRRPGTAIELLREREPDTKWNSASLLKGDLDQDGKDDYAATGIRGKIFVVGIVQGPAGPSSRHWTLKFPMQGGSQEDLCSTKAAIKLEEIEEEEEEAPGFKGLGINLYDDQCDAFHIFWNAEEKKFDWWRL